MAEGCVSAHGETFSKAADARSTVASSRSRPTTCSPTGRPSEVNPQGTLAAGCRVMLNTWLKGLNAQSESTARPAMVDGRWPMGNAGTASSG